MEESIEINAELIARCGLYCGACRKCLIGKCPGCRMNVKASWCKIRSCSASQGYHSCADCTMDVKQCKTYSNFVSKIFSVLFRSDRNACIARIREVGREAYATEMAKMKQHTIKRR